MTGETFHIGVDLGGTNIKFALIDAAGVVIKRKTVPSEAHEGHDAVLGRMIDGAREIARVAPASGAVTSIGAAVPGVIDMDTGLVKFLPNLPGQWPGVAVGKPMRQATGLPTFLINDVRAFTVAELELGAAKGATTALCYAIGTGIGGGVVAHGQVNLGVGGAGGELGHMVVNVDGPRCGCGNRGCAEAYASGPSITAEANRRILQGFTTILGDLVGQDLNKMSPAVVERAAEAGDEVAIEVLEWAGLHLGLAVASAIAALAPEVVVIGGGNVKPGGVFWNAIEATARANCHVTEVDRIAFRPAALGYDAGVIGAALWGMKRAASR
ncbi:MAG: glucokinase [Thermomicrobiales bacterium]|jgi:glucokinase|nr:glucokinase [Thermomicrobiales bacterium]